VDNPAAGRYRLFTMRIALSIMVCTASLSTEAVSQRADLSTLLSLHQELTALRQPIVVDGVADYSIAAMARQRQGLLRLRTRLDAIDPTSWPVADRIDYLLVRAQMNDLAFTHRVLVPWARDPGHYVDLIRSLPYTDTPLADTDRSRFVVSLRAVPVILTRARAQLTRPSPELARMAVFALERSDEVNQGEPRRPRPPAGVIGWYQDLVDRLTTTHADLVPHGRAALAAVSEYRDWLVARTPSMREPAGVGLIEYGWYLKNVRMVPYSVEQVRLIGDRELARGRTLYAIERHRNRGLPELEPVTTAEEHERRTREGERLIREFMTTKKLLTLPGGIPDRFETDAFFIDRSPWGGHRHFWDEITYRDPLNNHLHASIPGHRFDGIIQRRHPRPIRRGYSDGTRSEGWGFYIEEMFLQAGLLDQRPRTRELFYIAQLKRAARIPAELRMQTGEFTLRQAIDYLIDQVPLMEENLARYDLGIYLRQPAYGMNYTVGKAQLERLVSDRAQQLGPAFDLGAFHDEFLNAGMIPISLIRWEMTGLDDEVRALGLLAPPRTSR